MIFIARDIARKFAEMNNINFIIHLSTMNPLLAFVRTTTYEMTPAHLRLPPVLWTVFTALNQVHGIWRWYRRIELYRNPDNLVQLLAGHAVNILIGDTLLLRIAAQSLLVATRLLECTRQQSAVFRSGRAWIGSLKEEYPLPSVAKWDKDSLNSWLSPSSKYWWKRKGLYIEAKVHKVSLNSFKLLKNIFKLSVSMMDVIDALSWSPSARFDGVTESFVNITKWLNAIVENKEGLLTGITENKVIIVYLLKNSPFTYEQLVSGVTKAVEKTERIQENIKRISNIGGGIFVNLGKKMMGLAMRQDKCFSDI